MQPTRAARSRLIGTRWAPPLVYAAVYSRGGISELDIDDIVPDLIFSVVGVVPMVIAALLTYWTMRENPAKA